MAATLARAQVRGVDQDEGDYVSDWDLPVDVELGDLGAHHVHCRDVERPQTCFVPNDDTVCVLQLHAHLNRLRLHGARCGHPLLIGAVAVAVTLSVLCYRSNVECAVLSMSTPT